MALSFQDKIKTYSTTTPSFMGKIRSIEKEEPKTELPKETGYKPTFEASRGGAETIIPNVAKTFGNIPSSAFNLAKTAIAPVNPFDLDNPFNIGSNVVKGLGALGDIFGKRGVKGVGDIASGTAETVKKGVTLPVSAGKAGLSEIEKRGFGGAVAEGVGRLAETAVEDPLLIPSLVYAPGKVRGTGVADDLITKTARSTRLPQAIESGIEKVTPTVAKAVDDLEDVYTKVAAGTTAGKKATEKLATKTQRLNKSGTTGRTPQRTLAESGVVPKVSGTKLDTYEQGFEFADSTRFLKETAREGLQELEKSAPALQLENLRSEAIRMARSAQNINKGIADNLVNKINRNFDILRREYGDAIPATLADDIKSARWDKVFKNKAIVESDKLIKDADYLIAKSLQKNIEDLAESVGFKDLAQLNREIGDRLSAATFLQDLSGKTLKGGRVLKYLTTGIGATFGQTLPGRVLGAIGGNVIGSIIIKSQVSNPVKRFLLSRLRQQDPAAYTNTVNWLRRTIGERETRLLLEAPAELGTTKNPIITPAPTTYELPAQRINRVDSLPETQLLPSPKSNFQGESIRLPQRGAVPRGLGDEPGILPQSKSPNAAQTINAINNDSNIPINQTLPQQTPKSIGGVDKINRQGGFISIKPLKQDNQLTTKILDKLEGRETVSKQFISDLTNSGDLKQVERELIRDLLEKEGKTVNVPEFAAKVRGELLPLKVKNFAKSSKDAERQLQKMGYEVEAEMDNSLSILKNGQYIEYDDLPSDARKLYDIYTEGSEYATDIGSKRYESITLPDSIRGDVANYTENIYESPIKTSAGDVHFSFATDNYFGHTRIEDMADNKTRRVIEVQSDLYQKEGVERELVKSEDAIRNSLRELETTDTILEKEKISKEIFAELNKDSFSRNNKKIKELQNKLDELNNKTQEPLINKRKKELAKLKQYSNPTAHFRMVREEIKKAAQDGKTKLQFPTGKTAMKIEGLGESSDWFHFDSKLKVDDLEVGKSVQQGLGNDDWIITDVLGNGKFKAVLKSNFDKWKDAGLKNIQEALNNVAESSKETFDISGKVDTSNPIYKFYEKDLQKYLKKFDGKRVTDENGVEWIEVPVKKEYGTNPVDAFGKIGINPLTVGAGVTGLGVLGSAYLGNKLKE